ncbi:MAG: lysine--tRNA ligase, partial [Elusimicrobiota bacterium]|nr:lysine--tRNA ligase [Elusimicrobiota bacterium]
MQENNEQNNQEKTTGLDEIIKNKYREAAELKAAGINPYPAHIDVKNTCLEAKEMPEGADVVAAGRVVQLRLMGKAAFAHIKDVSGKLQIYVQK